MNSINQIIRVLAVKDTNVKERLLLIKASNIWHVGPRQGLSAFLHMEMNVLE